MGGRWAESLSFQLSVPVASLDFATRFRLRAALTET